MWGKSMFGVIECMRDIEATLPFKIKEARVDIETEEKENIKDVLWAIYKEDILKYSVFGLAQWWKEQLVLGENNATENSGSSEEVPSGVQSEESGKDFSPVPKS